MRNILLYLTSLPLLVASLAFAEEASIIEVKCYVALLGGGETIHFAKVNAINNQYNINDVGQLKITVADNKKKKEIYKVYECVTSDNEFTSSKARALESSMVW